jgi:phosphoglucosamine mutase
MLDHATTGDGVLTALHLLARVAQTRTSLADLAAVMERLPQVLVNVPAWTSRWPPPTPRWPPPCSPPRAARSSGRVLLRPSGTEPLVRVMVEALEPGQARRSPTTSPTWSGSAAPL